MKKAAIVYHYFAHYRAPVFRVLADSKATDYYFLGDPTPSNDIKRITFEDEKKLKNKFIPLKNTWLGLSFLWQSNLLHALRSNDFDAVIFLGDIKFISTWIAIVITRLKGKKAYLWGHGLYGRESWLNLKIKLLFLHISNGIFLYNNRAKELYLKNGISQDKLIVIYNSLNFDETESHRQKYNSEDKQKLVTCFSDPALPIAFCIGRINKIKKIEMLIRAIEILKNRNMPINCFVIGSGEEVPALKSLVSSLNLEPQISFIGSLYDENDISRYIMASDVCVCPGAVGLTVIHSLSYGVPVISNDNLNVQGPEHEAIIPGQTGAFYKQNDVNDLADKIQECILKRLADKEKSVQNCLSVVHDYYNPYYQRDILDRTILKNTK